MSKNKTVRNVFFTIFCLFACVSLGYAESCSSKGQVQYKYTASGCSYTTQSRTCCATTGEWSDWDKSCPSCSSSQCWNGSKCEDKGPVSRPCSGNVANASGGTQTRFATCTSSGWSYGPWVDNCTCKSNMYIPGSCTKCWVIKNKYGSNVQTYYITGLDGGTCCQPMSCQQYSFPPEFGATPCCADVSGAVGV